MPGAQTALVNLSMLTVGVFKSKKPSFWGSGSNVQPSWTKVENLKGLVALNT